MKNTDTFIVYDGNTERWFIQSTHAEHIKQWKKYVVPHKEEFFDNGEPKLLEGLINGEGDIMGYSSLTEEKRKEIAEMLFEETGKVNKKKKRKRGRK